MPVDDEEERPLSRVYLHPARLKIVETLLANPNHVFNLKELATTAEVDESSVHNHKEFLIELGILERVPRARYDGYQLAESDLVSIGQQWRDLHQDQLDEMNLDTAEAIEDFYGVAHN